MKTYKIVFLSLIFLNCTFTTPTLFSEKALQDSFLSLDGKSIKFQEILKKHKGKKILIDVWASWCADCIKGMPTIEKIQKEFPEIVFLFISVDKNGKGWKNGIKKHTIKGEHYNLPKGMKNGDFVDFLNLNWIPRYLVVDEQGGVTLFKATKSSDKKIVEALKK